MSGFLFLFHRNGKPADPSELESATNALCHRGPDGHQSLCIQSFAFSHFHFWTTPEDRGKTQPLRDSQTNSILVFDGRIDNRSDVYRQLALDQPLADYSDAELVFASLLTLGEGALTLLVGPFACIWCNVSSGKVLLARDPVGNRTLFYFANSQLFAAASEEYALLALCKLAPEPEPASIAAHFSLQPLPRGKTFFSRIHQLQPGHLLRLSASSLKEICYWHAADFCHPLSSNSAEAIIEEYQFLLQQAIHARCRNQNPIGLMLSGGLDSSTIAGLVNTDLQTLIPISYIFPSLPECDESAAIEAICHLLKLKGISFAAGNLWPMKDWDPKTVNPNGPEENLFRSLLTQIHHIAQAQTCQVLLSGDFGDHHFAGSHLWLWDSLRSGHWKDGLQQGLLNVKQHGWRSGLRNMGFGRKSHLRLPTQPPGYLSSLGKSVWTPPKHRHAIPEVHAIRSRALFDSWASRNSTVEISTAVRSGIEIRLPFCDLRLIKHAIRIPTYYLYRNAEKKWLLRQISSNIFQKSHIWPKKNMNLHSFFQLGLAKEKTNIKKLLQQSSNIWGQWISQERVYQTLDLESPPNRHNLLWWQCLTFSRWYKFHWKDP